MRAAYTRGKWKIIKKDGIYLIKEGRKIIDRSEEFGEAYSLLDKHRRSVK